jgi:hypothetical protein
MVQLRPGFRFNISGAPCLSASVSPMTLSPNRAVMLLFLVLLECLLLFIAASGSHVDKPDAGSAWYQWRAHPSAETESAWLGEKRKMRMEQAVIDVVIWLLIAAAGIGIYHVAKNRKQPS